jgi:hypothetical protein
VQIVLSSTFPGHHPKVFVFTRSRNLQEWSEEIVQLAFLSGMNIDSIDVLRSIGADSAIIIANRWDGPDELLAAAAHVGHNLPPEAATRLWTECERRVTIELLRRTLQEWSEEEAMAAIAWAASGHKKGLVHAVSEVTPAGIKCMCGYTLKANTRSEMGLRSSLLLPVRWHTPCLNRLSEYFRALAEE